QGMSWRRDRDSNPGIPVKVLLEFQSSAFDHSAISPACAPSLPEGARSLTQAGIGCQPIDGPLACLRGAAAAVFVRAAASPASASGVHILREDQVRSPPAPRP